MFAGIQEILLLLIIFFAIILFPRITARTKSARRSKLLVYSGRQRLAIVVSLIWPATMALYLSPWQNGWKYFMIVGIGPVVFGWSMAWVITGFKHRGKN